MAFSFVVLAGIVGFLWKARANYCALPELEFDHDPSKELTVIVPARNEAHQIERCVKSFASPVIVVDDGSTDDTADVAGSAGARVIQAPPLPAGHLGKPNACAAGAAAAGSEWILFVDADTWYAAEFEAAIVGYARRNQLDMVTAFLHQQRETWAEKIVLPYAFALYFCGVSARSVNAAGGEALANGQCLLVRREAYERIGGHASVAGSVIEDVALARVAKQTGLRVRVTRAEKLGSVRMYDSFGAIWRGLEKNSFRFLQANPLTGVQVIAASILLTSWLLAIVLAGDVRLASAVALAPILMLKPWYGSWREAALAPLGIYAFQLIALAGMLKTLTGAKSLWKGRRV